MRVWIWRKPQRGRLPGWYGPGLILVKTTSGAYVQVAGALWKVSEQNMRPQSEDDKLGWQMVNRFLHHLRHEMAQDKPLKKRYVDCTREAAPQEEETPAFPSVDRPEGFDQQALEEEQQPDVPLAVAEIAPDGVPEPTPMGEDEESAVARGD
eukprot:3942622-Amphidinium_carterae.1